MGLVILKDLPELEIAPGIKGRAVTSDTMTIMHVTIEKDANLPKHSHYHEQVVNVVEGELELVLEGVPHLLNSGNSLVIPPNAVHWGKAKTAVKVVDVFHPIRQDFAGKSFGGYNK
ncbi:MAG: cupin domain-containing protein [Candidatus Zixiibacteriota bacterium]